MNSCEEIQSDLVHYVNDELVDEKRRLIKMHLEDCLQCTIEQNRLEKLRSALDLVEDIEVPFYLRDQTLQLIEEDNVNEFVSKKNNKFAPGMGKILAAVGIGVLQVMLYGKISGNFTSNQSIPLIKIVTACVLWCGMIILAVLLVFNDFKEDKQKIAGIALIGLVGLIVVAFIPFIVSSRPLFYLWQVSTWGRQFAARLGADGSTFVFGILYGLVPMSMVAFFLGSKIRGKILENAFLSGIIFICLLIPAIYLQSYTLFINSSIILISWAGGALIGAVGGVWSGLKLYRLHSIFVRT